MGIINVDQYVGFSSYQFEKNKTFILTNIDLVKEDLRRNIFTKRGSRPKMPTYGTRIPDLIFEQLDDTTLNIINQDLTAVFNYDPRVTLNELRILPLYENNAVQAIADLNFVYLNFNGQMDIMIQFES